MRWFLATAETNSFLSRANPRACLPIFRWPNPGFADAKDSLGGAQLEIVVFSLRQDRLERATMVHRDDKVLVARRLVLRSMRAIPDRPYCERFSDVPL
jgi:hypothetical protein